jgi:hypothetical protein
MNRDDIIRMAREAEIHVYPEFEKAFERFANLIRADEREACAKEADTTFYSVQAAENIRARNAK